MNRLPFRLRLCATFSVLLALAAPPVHAGEIKILMRDMKHAMQGAMSSRTIPELSGYVTRLESDAQQASHQSYRDDQPTYDEGMRILRDELTEVDRAIQANDLAAAKQALRRINGTRKRYHDLLG
ncbi:MULTISPECIES: cytochrome b562 [Burkholderia cepacia complex]|uniref:cytochrome b562 n=1 Tax=Burkholderia cepacia complex TaxID=87882 RepID=UPI00073AA4AD|nr:MULTISPECIES: cytochrome b562 [Burkholderia cepacia complex]ALV61658.1 cytochrome B562 [Burkholderia cenocepacia]AQQ48098.1 cytochrome B562 [Burkholderia cenocepacia]ONJ04186.1 cytochrome B562 [Burkholderia cenocepacia]ONJ09544.1 cytochrome B562 [Burkholderia cenocepacia]ONJ29285.1 cytochrome B562 [Burkholderia cenocepacia]